MPFQEGSRVLYMRHLALGYSYTVDLLLFYINVLGELFVCRYVGVCRKGYYYLPLLSQVWHTSNESNLAHIKWLRFGPPLMIQIQPTSNDSELTHL